MQLFERFEMFSNCFFPHCIGQLGAALCFVLYATLRFGFVLSLCVLPFFGFEGFEPTLTLNTCCPPSRFFAACRLALKTFRFAISFVDHVRSTV